MADFVATSDVLAELATALYEVVPGITGYHIWPSEKVPGAWNITVRGPGIPAGKADPVFTFTPDGLRLEWT